MGVPKMVGFTIENAIKMDDLGVPPFQETSIYQLIVSYKFRPFFVPSDVNGGDCNPPLNTIAINIHNPIKLCAST